MKGQFTVNKCSHGQAEWRVEGKIDGRRVRAFFRTRELAVEHARIRNIELQNSGQELAGISNDLRAEALRCQKRLEPLGVSLTVATAYYLEHHDVRTKSVPLKTACEALRNELQRRLEHNEKCSVAYVKSTHKALERLEPVFGERQICDLSAQELWNYLAEMPVAAASKNNYRVHWSVLFEFAKDRGWLKENTIAKVKTFGTPSAELPGIFSVEEARRLLEVARPEMVPMLAIGFFAGIRPAEIRRLNWNDIIWPKKLIDIKSKISKTARARWVTMPLNLIEWLAPYRQESGRIVPFTEWMQYYLVTATRKAAGLAEWPQDGLRHSFGSYHLALHQNSNLTAHEMGHMTATMIYAHYNNRVMKEQAQAYFSIRPAAALTEKIVPLAV